MTRNMSHYRNINIKHLFLTLWVLVIGVTGAWGQTHPYAGVWYITNSTNSLTGYWVPAADPQITSANHVYEDAYFSSDYTTQNGDPEKPFLTTFPTGGDLNSIWILKPVTDENDYYYIVHALTGKYLKYQTYLTGDNARRKYVHLETIVTPGETEKFEITAYDSDVKIKPKDNDMYFNIAGNNQNAYHGSTGNKSPYFSGIIGGMEGYNAGSKFTLIDASTATALTPVISDVSAGTITITSPAAAFSTIRYTTDGSTTPDASTGTSATSGGTISEVGRWTVQAVGVFGTFVTPMAGPKALYCYTPLISYDNSTSEVSIASATEGVAIYYTTDGSTPTSSSTPYSAPFSITGLSSIKAIAIKSGLFDSEEASVSVVSSPTINLATTTYTYDGTPKEPVVSSVMDGLVEIPGSEYDVEYSNNINAGTATVTITDKDGGDYIVFGSQDFTINKGNITPSVTIDGWTYGASASTPSVTINDNPYDEGVSYAYKTKGAADGTYTPSAPTNAGEYTIRATIAATTNYNAATATADFTISPKSLGDGVRASEGVDMTLVNNVVTVKDGETTLVEDTDYEISTEGEFVIVSGKGNYTGSAKLLSASAVFSGPFAGPNETVEYVSAYTSSMDVLPPVGVTPYMVKMVYPSIGIVTLTEVGYIPEGVPVLLVANSDKSNFAASPIGESTVPISDAILSSNKLKVAPAGGVTVESTEAYIFYRGEFVLTQAGTISEGKIFLYNPDYSASPGAPSPRRFLRMVKEEEEDPTGNDNGQLIIDNGPWIMDNVIYDLSGRRVNGQLPKGLYIVNGQKVIVK